MLGRFRSAIYSAIGPLDEEGIGEQPTRFDQHYDTSRKFWNISEFVVSWYEMSWFFRQTGGTGVKPNKQKYSYQRPAFLKLVTEDEIQVRVHSIEVCDSL